MISNSPTGSSDWPGFEGVHRWIPRTNRLSRILSRFREAGTLVLDLTVSNPTQAALDLPLEILRKAWQSALEQPYDPDPRGTVRARRAISDYYSERNLRVEAADLLLTASTSEAYSLIFKLFAGAGRAVLVPSPSYPLLEDLCRLEGLLPEPYSLERIDNDWYFPDSVEVSPGTSILLIVDPNNPTGSVLRTGEWDIVQRLCRDHRLLLIRDEVFSEYRFPDWAQAPAPTLEMPNVRLNGISKIAGLPQFKLAWLAVDGPEEFKRATLARLEVIADSYLSVNTPVQWLLPEILKNCRQFQDPIRRRIAGNRAFAAGFHLPKAAQFLPPAAGWNAMLRLPRIRSDEEWALKLLRESQVLVHPGYLFGVEEEGFIVISLLTPSEDFQEGLARLGKHL